MQKELIMATNNVHKLEEVRQMLEGKYIVRGLSDIGCTEDIPETSPTLEGNALQKARYVHEHYHVDCFADDTGLEVEALDGKPGVFTARFGAMNGFGESHDPEANIRCLLHQMEGKENRHGRFRTAVALIRDGEEHLFEGIVEGNILSEKKGKGGFGYDPIFAPDETGLSFSEMGAEEKNRISHRARAIQKLIAFLSCLLLYFFCLPAHAQQIGEWQVYPSFWNSTYSLKASHVVYALYEGNLLAYDTEDTSIRTFDWTNGLSDIHITHMDYSAEAKKLILVYENGNIDLMDEEERVRNLSSLKDKVLAGKEVTQICIDGSLAYLTTSFGFVVIDLEEEVFADTYRFPVTVNSVAIWKDYVCMATTEGLYYCSRKENVHQWNNWKKVIDTNCLQLVSFRDKLFYRVGWAVYYIDPETGKYKNNVQGKFSFLRQFEDMILWGNDNSIVLCSDIDKLQTIEINNKWKDICYDKGTYWISEGDGGLGTYKLEGSRFVKTGGPIQPNSPRRDLSYRMHWEGDRLLVAGGINTIAATYNDPVAMYYEDHTWTNLPQLESPEKYANFVSANTTDLVQDPQNANRFFASQHRNGLVEYTDNKVTHFYNCDNSPIRSILPDVERYYNYCSCSGLQYDKDGNLWMLNSETDTIVRILKHDGKWTSLYYSEIAGVSLCDDYLMHSSGLMFLNSRRMDHRGFFCFDTKGTLNSTRDDRHILRSTIINQDGTSYSPDEFYCLTEDLDGRVWCGTNLGVFVINEPQRFFDDDFRYEQVKISRNDGSGLADYLLSGVSISCIAIDGANRKWIGTHTNGIYLLSEDGTEMLHHFTPEDSPLPSTTIQCIAVHPTTGRVFIGTDRGICSYVSDATEAVQQLGDEDVVAYPNPVGPDYTGPIAVRGLSTDSEVKILSTSGQLVWSGVSSGGTFTWNGCNAQGKRVASGIYHIVASNAEGKKAIVSRIVMVK